MMENADPAVKRLTEIAYDSKQSPEIRLKATLAIIDRAGLSPRQAMEIEVGPLKPWEGLLNEIAGVESGSRAAFRQSMGISDPPPALAERDQPAMLPNADADAPIDAELIHDFDMVASMRSRANQDGHVHVITPEGDEWPPGARTVPGADELGDPVNPFGPSGLPSDAGMMTLEDAVAAQGEMRRAIAARPTMRALPPGPS